MESDNGGNYWQGNDDEATEMYAPSPDEETPTESAPEPEPKLDYEPVHWQATEYIHEEKDGLWFAIFGLVVLALIALDIFFFHSYTFSALVVVMAVSVVVFAKRPPRTINYTLSQDQGLYIGETLHHFNEFKAFGLIEDRNHHSIMLIPTKRFSPGVSVYFPVEAGEQIVDILGSRLPMQPLKLDAIDIIVQKLRL